MRDQTDSTNPRTPECSDVLSALPLYVGQDLDSVELDSVARHLEDCDPCAAHHERAHSARAVLAAGAWATPDSEGPSLWEGVRAGMVAEGLIGSGPRLVSDRHTATPIGPRSLAGARVPGGRWWIGSGAAAAALFLAFGLSGLFGPLESGGEGFTGSAVDVGGTRPTVSIESRQPSIESRKPGHLRRAGTDRSPLLHDAVEWLPEQGIYVPVHAPAKPSLVEGPKRLRPVQK